jgi:hypothetical protein
MVWWWHEAVSSEGQLWFRRLGRENRSQPVKGKDLTFICSQILKK